VLIEERRPRSEPSLKLNLDVEGIVGYKKGKWIGKRLTLGLPGIKSY
jgi:hypothetical protein